MLPPFLLYQERAFLLASRALKIQCTKEIHAVVENTPPPSPTISSSAFSRFYKRRDDVTTDVELRKHYGKRFEGDFTVYIRLLETLEDIKLN